MSSERRWIAPPPTRGSACACAMSRVTPIISRLCGLAIAAAIGPAAGSVALGGVGTPRGPRVANAVIEVAKWRLAKIPPPPW